MTATYPHDSAEQDDALSAEQLELLAYLMEAEGAAPDETPATPSIAPRPNPADLPLSFGQQRLWFLEQWKTGTATYHIPAVLRMEGQLDLAALEHGLNTVVARHAALRAVFPTEEGQPRQALTPPTRIPVHLIDLQAFPAAEREAEARRQAEADNRRPFNLSTGPLLRVSVLRLAPEDHVLVLTMHHIISDGWSMGLFFGEWATVYRAHLSGHVADLPALPIEYADYAYWQHHWLKEHVLPAQSTYWQARLRGSNLILPLPTDRLRPSTPSLQGAWQAVAFPPALGAGLARLSQQAGTTLFMTLVAAFNVLLYRYTGHTDVLIGTPIANRTRRELEGLIGLFINTLVLRNDLSGNPTFLALLARVRETTLEAFAHQDLPFEQLVEVAQPQRDPLYTPIFQVMFVLQNLSAGGGLTLPGLTLTPWATQTGTAKFDLTLTLQETDDGLQGSFEYNTDLFEAETIARLAANFQVLLTALVADPTQHVASAPLLTPAEASLVVTTWNAPHSPAPALLAADDTIVSRFIAQTRRTPTARALTMGTISLTYAELAERATRLAEILQSWGVGPDVPVALCVERSPEMLVAILGILLAGGVYVPLDPTYPTERLAFALRDTAAPVLLTQQSLRERVPAVTARILCLDEAWPTLSVPTPPRAPLTAAHMAYVIYTSGSTGQPKGVCITHANVLRLLDATDAWYHFGASDVWTLFHSYAFDFSVWEIWGALLYGGRLVIVPYTISRTPDAFYRLLADECVTVLNQTPSAFRQLITAEEALAASGPLPQLSLRYVIFGGEALDLPSLRPWYARHGASVALINMYGITETTVHVTYRPVDPAEVEAATTSPIGHAIPDLTRYVLAPDQRPAPIGVPGELYVGGAGLARGYLNRPMLTAERFVPDPFSATPGARLYRTGDLVRYRANGEMDYLGRIDYQVKIRGFRIELGEIEAALSRHPALRETLVIAHTTKAHDQQLVVYGVPVAGHTVTISDLRQFLKATLPDHMLPAVFIALPAFPLTPNGKIDRKALPEPGTTRPTLAEAYVAPHTPLEKRLAAIWAEVLGMAQVGVQDNFFALGGDSIRSVRVLALARKAGLTFSLEQFFKHQTVAALAHELETAVPGAAQGASSVPFSLVNATDRAQLPPDLEDAYPLAMLQAGMLYHMALTPDIPVYHNVDSFLLRARCEMDALRQAVQTVVARHPVLRTGFEMTRYSEPLQLVYKQAELPITFEDLRGQTPAAHEARLIELVTREKAHPFDLSRPPLIRFHIQQLTDDTLQFTLTECHAIFDGWSLTSTLAEIFNHYATLLEGQPLTPEPPLASSFREFIRLERATLDSDESRRYWSAKLRDATPLTLPPHPEPDSTADPRVRAQRFDCPPAVFAGLQMLVHSAGVPLKSILLATHLKALSAFTGQSDVLTGLTCNGRPEESDGDQIRGLFLNTLPLRVRLTPSTWRDFIQAAFAAERDLLPFRRHPLVALQKDWGRQALFTTAFNFVHFHALEGLSGSGQVQMLELSYSSNDTSFPLSASFSLNQIFWGDQVAPLALILQYDATQLSDAQVAQLGAGYLRVLTAIATNPQAPHSTLSVFPLDATLVPMQSAPAAPEPKSFVALWEAQVARTPDTPAVVCGATTLTYRTLDAHANRLAHYLRDELGVQSETLVGLCVERSADMLVGILGVLKAGGAYLPLDPTYPPERLAFMLADARVTVLLTQHPLLATLPPHSARVLCLDTDWPRVLEKPGHAPATPIFPEQRAYVIYTSGSTGRSKGVQLHHRGLCNLTAAQITAFDLQPGQRVVQLASLSFDASVFEIVMALRVGSTLYLGTAAELRPGPDLTAFLQTHHITNLTISPSVLAALPESDLPALRTLVVAGEACPPELVSTWAPGRRFFNAYGPTETTVWATYAECVPNGLAPAIGRAISGAWVYVLDDFLQPVPTGVTGELYIGGVGVARGYLGRAALTAERFVPDPLATVPGARLYRTGDLARYRPDGQLEFMGRRDDQVKVRGFRIELGEIESALAQHPALQHAVVVTYTVGPGDTRLAAYYVARPGQVPEASDLRAALAARLPAYMVPTAYIPLEAMPLSPSGKLDRRALPRPDGWAPTLSTTFVLPQSALERTIAEVWQTVLKVERVGAEDNFFDLGGNSLLMARVHNQLRTALSRDVPMVALFEHPTIAALAQHLSQAEQPAPSLQASTERGTERRDALQRQRQLRQERRGTRS